MSIFLGPVFAEHPDSSLKQIREHLHHIAQAAKRSEVDPAVLAAIIYTERTLNYDWRDTRFDIPLFKELGRNSSIGFCQIKVKTAYFIEVQLNREDQPYFPGPGWAALLPVSESRETLLQKITCDSLNILYAALYLRLMQSRWAGAGYPIDDRPDILGTLYSTGLYYEDGSERRPNAAPQSNAFGNRVKAAMPLFRPLFRHTGK